MYLPVISQQKAYYFGTTKQRTKARQVGHASIYLQINQNLAAKLLNH